MNAQRAGQFDYDAAIEQWRKLVETSSEAYNDRRLSKAEEGFVAALKEVESWPKADASINRNIDVCLAKSLNNLAALYQSQGKYSFAEAHYQRALEINHLLYPGDDSQLAVSIENLATLYCTKNKFGEAEPLFRQALSMKEKLFGSDHPQLISTINNYVRLLNKINRADEANELDQRAAKIAEANKMFVG